MLARHHQCSTKIAGERCKTASTLHHCSNRTLYHIDGPHTISQRLCVHVAASNIENSPTQRRGLLLGSCASLALASSPPPAKADADLSGLFKKAFPPPPSPILFPRKQLDINFAVLLMRSSYDAVDDLDFIPMDKFQIQFWKLRQAEQEGYFLQYSPLKVRQGDLTDPLYFDYISYAQYAVIGREMPKGAQIFQEPCDVPEDCDFKLNTIRRDPSLADNKLLPPRFTERVGDIFLRGLQEGFRDEVFGAPPKLPTSAGADQVVEKLQELLNIMVGRGFAIRAEILYVNVDNDGRRASFKTKIQGSANLWGLASLSFRRSPVVNNYSAMLLAAYIRACERNIVKYDLEYTDTFIEEEWVFE